MTQPSKARKRTPAAPVAEEAVEAAVVVEEPVAVEEVPAPAPAPEPVVEKAPRRSALALSLKRPLSQGNHAGQVDDVMNLMAGLGWYTGPRDGRYGTRLARAVRHFQSAAGLRVTGDVDVLTWEALHSPDAPRA